MIKKFSTLDNDFDSELDSLIAWDSSIDEEISNSVKKIIDDVRHIGDRSVLDYTQKFDSIMAKSISELTISKESLKQSFDNLKNEQKDALLIAAERIKSYHQNQVQESWNYSEDDGTVLGQKITPLERAGALCSWRQGSIPILSTYE